MLVLAASRLSAAHDIGLRCNPHQRAEAVDVGTQGILAQVAVPIGIGAAYLGFGNHQAARGKIAIDLFFRGVAGLAQGGLMRFDINPDAPLVKNRPGGLDVLLDAAQSGCPGCRKRRFLRLRPFFLPERVAKDWPELLQRESRSLLWVQGGVPEESPVAGQRALFYPLTKHFQSTERLSWLLDT